MGCQPYRNRNLRLLYVIFALLLLVSCSSVEDALSNIFEKINASNPLPKNYGKDLEDHAPSPTNRQNNLYSGGNFNGSRDSEASFEEWHSNQY
jgi:hypothetical protein